MHYGSMQVMHSRADQIVPIDDSRALCRAAGVTLTEVEGEAHKLFGIAPEPLVSMVRELGAAEPEGTGS